MKTIIDGKVMQQVARDIVKLKGSGVQVQAQGDQMRFIAASSLDNQVILVQKFDADVTEEGNVFIPHDTLKLVSKLKGNTAAIGTETILSGSRKLTYVNSDMTVDLPAGMEHVATFSRADYLKILDARYAASKQETQPVLQNVLLRGNNVYATDRHRLAMYEVSGNTHAKDTLLPAAALQLLDGITRKGCPDQVKLYVNGQWACLEVGNTEMYMRLVDGNFPDVTKVIPNNFNSSVTFDKTQMMEELNVLKSVSKWVTLDGNMLESYDPDVEGGTTLVCELTEINGYGDRPVIAFDTQYMLDAVKYATEDTVEIKINNPTHPFVINDTALVLPVRRS